MSEGWVPNPMYLDALLQFVGRSLTRELVEEINVAMVSDGHGFVTYDEGDLRLGVVRSASDGLPVLYTPELWDGRE